MWERILLWFDGSPESAEAAHETGKLARLAGSQVHVVAPPPASGLLEPPPGRMAESMADTLDEAQQLVEAALAELRAEDIKATGEVLPRTESRGAQIVEVARKKQAALIVVGSHGGGSRLHKMVS